MTQSTSLIGFIIEISILSGGLIPLMFVLLCGVIAIVIERFYYFHRVVKAGEAMEHDLELVKPQNVDQMTQVAKHYENAPQSRIITAAVAVRGQSPEAMDRQIEETLLWQLPKLDRNMWMLDTAVTLGPLLGLFGTIIGMVESFSAIGLGGANSTGAVTGGIGHALMATAVGLMIAIIGVSLLNYFNKRIRIAMHQMELIKVMVINRLSNTVAPTSGSDRAAGNVNTAALKPQGA